MLVKTTTSKRWTLQLRICGYASLFGLFVVVVIVSSSNIKSYICMQTPNGWVAKKYILCLHSCSIHHTQNTTTQNTSSHMQNLIISRVAHQSPFGRGSYQQSTYRIVPTANLQDYTKQSTNRIIPVNLQDSTSQLTGLYQQSISYRKHQLSFDLYLIHILENVHQYCLLSLTSSHLSVVTSATTGINQSNHRSAEI